MISKIIISACLIIFHGVNSTVEISDPLTNNTNIALDKMCSAILQRKELYVETMKRSTEG